MERFGAAVTHDLPVFFISEAAWIVDLLEELQPGATCLHVPNGIDKQTFAPAASDCVTPATCACSWREALTCGSRGSTTRSR